MTARDQAQRALKTYPSSWRREHGEALIGTLLDIADAAGREALTKAETRDIVLQGLMHRVQKLIGGRLVQLVGLWAMVTGTALAMASLILGEFVIPLRSTDPRLHGLLLDQQAGDLPVHTTGPVLYLVWLLLAIAALRGSTRRVRQLAIAVVFIMASLPLCHHFLAVPRPPLGVLGSLGVLAALVAAVPWRAPDLRRAAGAGLIVATVVTLAGLPLVLTSDPTQTNGYIFYSAFDVQTMSNVPGFGYGQLGGRLFFLIAPVSIAFALLTAAAGTAARAIANLVSSRGRAQST